MRPLNSGEPAKSVRGRERKILSHVLADESLLYVAARDFRENTRGPQVSRLRHLFDRHFRQVAVWLRLISRRSRAIARGRLTSLARFARLSAPAAAGLATRTKVVELHALHQNLARRLQTDIADCREAPGSDPATATFLEELRQFHEATARRLEELLADRRQAGF